MGVVKSIFLTGATGYLGSNLTLAFVEQKFRVTILLRKTSDTRRINSVLDQVKILYLEDADFNQYFSENLFDAVVHTAASYGRSTGSIMEVAEPNLILPLKLLHAAILSHVPYFFNTDTALPKELNNYAFSKHQFREWLEVSQKHLTIINIQLQYFFGEGDDKWKFVNSIIHGLIDKKASIDFTEAQQERDFIYIQDAVSAYLHLIAHADKLTGFQTYDLGSGQVIKLKDLIRLIDSKFPGNQTKLNFGAIPMRDNEIMYSKADTSLLNAIGWAPIYTLEQGIIKTIESEIRNHANS